MLKDLVNHVETHAGLSNDLALAAVGIVLNAAERQGAPVAEHVFCSVPGTRQLAASAGNAVGAATGLIARMIEKTPGGRSEVAFQMIRDLQEQGLGHTQISAILPSIAGYARDQLGFKGEGHLGDFFAAKDALQASAV